MLFWIFIFVLIVAIYFSGEHLNGISRRTFACLMAVLALVVGLGDMLGGYDRYIYGQLFDIVADAVRHNELVPVAAIIRLYGKEPGYMLLNLVIAYLTANRYIFIFIVTILIYWLFYKSFLKTTANLGYALILFLGLYFFFTFTYLRQAIAIGFIWYSYRYIYAHKIIKFGLCVLLASSFHNSALLFFPMYFVAGLIPSKKNILIGSVICLVIGLSGVPSVLFELYGEASDNLGRANEYLNDTSGFRLEYVIEAFVFVTLIIFNHSSLSHAKIDRINLNIALGFCFILLLFCKSLNGGRLCWPFILGLICTLCTIGNSLGRFSLRAYSLILLSFFLYIRILFGWGIMLSPYKTFLTSGVRSNDYIYYKYEYDTRYARDKFYR